jgi:UDP-N-acetylmuramate dehydrogenase
VGRLRETLENFNIQAHIRYEEPLASHTSFQVGGPADAYVAPTTAADIGEILSAAATGSIPVFVLGAGANILVSDRGIDGLVLDTKHIRHITVDSSGLQVGCGYQISDVAVFAAERGFSGPEFLYAMPGSVGGSVWMNARCYGTSISDIIEWVTLIDRSGELSRYTPTAREFAYKKSPFQGLNAVIYEACLRVSVGNPRTIRARMREIEEDRRSKGHFEAPSAGSVFKNNRAFGSPTGKIVDELGLKGYRIGGAQVSPVHGNIIVNTGSATAEDIMSLILHIEATVKAATGYELEREVIPVGRWSL